MYVTHARKYGSAHGRIAKAVGHKLFKTTPFVAQDAVAATASEGQANARATPIAEVIGTRRVEVSLSQLKPSLIHISGPTQPY